MKVQKLFEELSDLFDLEITEVELAERIIDIIKEEIEQTDD